MGGFKILPKGYSLSFRLFRQHLTQLWLLEPKLDLPVAEFSKTMISKSELTDHLRMTLIGSLSNFKSIEHQLTVHQSTTSPLNKIKSTGDETPHNFKTQIRVYGWSYLLFRRLHLKFHIIPTSFDLVFASNGKSTKRSSAFLENQETFPSDLQDFSSSFL